MISKRLAANLRKRAIIEGSFGSFTATEGIIIFKLYYFEILF